MTIKGIAIKKFRGFAEIEFQLGEKITVIAGQNGTQKTTLLGMLSQPFSITDKSNPMLNERPLCGGNFKSGFSEKFKLSDDFDKPREHEWTLSFCAECEPDFTVQSMQRSKSEGIRFWKKGDRSKGSGYVQLPVVYLSLSRLFPIGEDASLNSSTEVELSEDEFVFYEKWHNKILIIPDVEMKSADYLASKQKNTLGVNTEFYDWKMNSAGQDNIGKILLAILSFKRLKENHQNEYSGGILAIDEIDATLYPASQVELLKALRKFASQYNIQIIFTTHSLTLLEKACKLQEDERLGNQARVIFLEKRDREIDAIEGLTFEAIMHKLNVTMSPSKIVKKVTAFTEDEEGRIFAKAILKRKASALDCVQNALGCSNLVELAAKKIVGFKFPDSLIVLDGDVKGDRPLYRKASRSKNVILLPGTESPERLLANFLYQLPDGSETWSEIKDGYNKQVCFRTFTIREIRTSREKAKDWFKEQMPHWGRGCARAINPWIDANKDEVDLFIQKFDAVYEKYAKALSIS